MTCHIKYKFSFLIKVILLRYTIKIEYECVFCSILAFNTGQAYTVIFKYSTAATLDHYVRLFICPEEL